MCKNGNPFQAGKIYKCLPHAARSPSASLGGRQVCGQRSMWGYRTMQPELVSLIKWLNQSGFGGEDDDVLPMKPASICWAIYVDPMR